MMDAPNALNVNLKEVIAPAFYEVHKAIKRNAYTFYWLSGGRGSTKSSFISIEIILGMMKDKDANAVILRKVKDTLRESVHEQLLWAISALGVDEYWEESVSPLTLTYKPTGQKIVYRGADKPKRIKGIKFSRGYTKFLWYEELDEFGGMAEIRLINQSLIRGGVNTTVFYSYNPPMSGNNWVNTEKLRTRADRLVHHSDYLSVPPDWLGPQFLMDAEHLKETNLSAYQHEYLGHVVGSGGEVFRNVTCRKIEDFEIHGNDALEIAGFWNIKRGVDFGYAVDPFSYIVLHYDRKKKRVFIFHELYKVGLSNTMAITHIKSENKTNDFLTADSSEPKSISEFRQHGLRVKAAKKGPDSVEYGIKFLQDLEEIIIDDTRCPFTAEEFLQYELERDKTTGEWKAGFPDKNNHSIDAVRYALNEEVMKHRDHKKKEKDPDNLSPSEKVDEFRRKLGASAPIKSLTKW